MEGFFENSNYKSGWKPLSKGNNISVIKTRSGSEISDINIANSSKPTDVSNLPEQINNAKKPSANDDITNSEDKSPASEVSTNNTESYLKTSEGNNIEKTDILKEISKISTDIETLNSMLLEQNEKIDNLLNLIEKKDASGKKNVFGLSWK